MVVLSKLQKLRLVDLKENSITRKVRDMTDKLGGTFVVSYKGVPYGVVEVEGMPLHSICWFEGNRIWRVFIGTAMQPPFGKQEKFYLLGDQTVIDYFAGIGVKVAS